MAKRNLSPVYLNGEVYKGAGQKLPKRYRCKSRKRYIKLLMSEGLGRELAREIAEADRVFYGSYERAWKTNCINRENHGIICC